MVTQASWEGTAVSVSPLGLCLLSSGPVLYSGSPRPFPPPPEGIHQALQGPASLTGCQDVHYSISWGHRLATQASNETGRQLCHYLLSETSQSCSVAQAGCHLLVHYCGTMGLRQIDPEACSRLPACYCVSGKLLNSVSLKPQLSNM